MEDILKLHHTEQNPFNNLCSINIFKQAVVLMKSLSITIKLRQLLTVISDIFHLLAFPDSISQAAWMTYF